LVDRARELGWKQVEVIDCDLGSSATIGAPERKGFNRLIASIALGEVGVVFSREISRLLRTDKDWCQLVEVCQVFGSLVADATQIYDVNLLDDQLILGFKGTLSVVEYKQIQMRLIDGMRAKARRGELVRLLPPGYVRDNTGKVVKDPDERVQTAIALTFRKFREIRSIRQTCLWFHIEGVELPVNKSAGDGMNITWQLPSQAFLGAVLHNPFYAGAFVWGQRPIETKLVGGRLTKRQGRLRRPEECEVFIPDHHESYIDWETFQDNLRVMRGNNLKCESDESVAAVRAGNGLLVGLLRCGHCGRKLHVRYWGKSGTAARYLCKGDFDSGGRYYIGFGGGKFDQRFSEELLEVLSPLGVRASLRAIERLSAKNDEVQDALRRQLNQLEYEARRAFEQYNEVDPRNRLVAGELERRWNGKLEEVEQANTKLMELQSQNHSLTEEDEARVFDLGDNFERVWRDERCPVELKKKILRAAVEEVIVNLNDDETTLHFVVHWKGGTHTRFDMPKPMSGVGRKTELEDLEIIRKMASRGYGDDEIARVLTNLGRKTVTGKRWTEPRVKTARRRYSIAGQKRRHHDPEILTRNEAARHCGVSAATIKKLVEAGVLTKEQVSPWAPWEIRRADLDSESVRAIVERLRKTGRLRLGGDDSIKQLTFFKE
jgi:DNA invertase Pin-like site-specific DNA recombinase